MVDMVDGGPLPLPPVPAGPFVFVSYASVDRARVLAVAGALDAAGIALWIDQAGIAGGAAYGAEIAAAVQASATVALMCSAASLASRNVRQEIMLAWRYDRPILPLLLEPTSFPDDVAYWLEGAQWIEVFDRPADAWLPDVLRALRRVGFSQASSPAEDIPAPPPEIAAGPGNLVAPGGQLIGRDREVRELTDLLGQGRWLTLTGPGGVGKTRLAVEVAHRLAGDFPGGAWFVDLAPVTNPAGVAPAIAAVFDVAEEADHLLVAALADHVRGQRTLLLLDNMEQVAVGAAAVATLSAACPDLVILATSRAPLRVPVEWVYPIGHLALPDLDDLPPLPALAQSPAVRLFAERARDARKEFVLTEGTARTVAEICHRLDGLPLAIELAAARVRLLPVATIRTRLGSRLNLLTGGAGTTRQQTLRDTIDWSYDLLPPAEQAAFCRLAVFSGGATIEAGEAILAAAAGDASRILDEIAALADASLLRLEGTDPEAAPRIRMLETIREFASERLAASGEEEAARAAHASYFLGYAERCDEELGSPRPGATLASMRADEENLRAALDWLSEHPGGTTPDGGLCLATALIRFWQRLGRYHEAESRLSAAVDRHPHSDTSLRAKALIGAGFMAARRGERQTAAARYEEALALRRTMGDRSGEADVVQYLAEVAEEAGDFAQAQYLREQVLAIRRQVGDELGVATAMHDLGVVMLYQGDQAAAISQVMEAIPLFRRLADARNLALSLDLLTGAEMLAGRDEAIRHAEESLALWRTLDDRSAVAYALVTYGRALQLAGRHDEASRVLEEGRAECEELGDPGGVSLALYGLGVIALAHGDDQIAFDRLAESLRLSYEAKEAWHIAERVEALAGVWAVRGELARAARALGAAAAMREAGDFPVPPAERADLERTRETIVAALGPGAMAAAMAAGRALPLDDLVADVLGEWR
ncbi:MAG: tetratricopeptide repeat protein [Chloroflexota bacterium]|nr:tetratricopeptide repeat protein [Chloroflexota bacterium]